MKRSYCLILLLTMTIMSYAQDQTISGTLIIDPEYKENYSQGLRINEALDKWSVVVLGSTGKAGTHENAWLLGRSPKYNFVISRNSATGLNGMVITKAGNIGFGIENPQCKLEVNGIIRSKEVKVEATGWSDFVFHKDYQLPSLQTVEKYINDNGHLPDIPNEKEVMENGISIGEMQSKLLQKIEELTLYIIQQDRNYNDLKQENIFIKQELQKLKQKLN